ncbi:UNVERIFIED_CONTAM: hypothetical protein NCL1_15036 [Trichonephila clavipes]
MKFLNQIMHAKHSKFVSNYLSFITLTNSNKINYLENDQHILQQICYTLCVNLRYHGHVLNLPYDMSYYYSYDEEM